MKKHLVFVFFLSVFCVSSMFAELKVKVRQSIRYGNGDFVAMDTPQISRKSARKEGGKVFLRYEFEVEKFGGCDVIVCIRFPDKYSTFKFEGSPMKVTALSGATDLRLEVLEIYKGTDFYSGLRASIGNLPRADSWHVDEAEKKKGDKKKGSSSYYEFKTKESFIGIPLKMPWNKKGSKALIEFYIDFDALEKEYNYWKNRDAAYANWLGGFLCNEIPIDITFHNHPFAGIPFLGFQYYSLPTKDFIDKNGYTHFFINLDNLSFYDWRNYSLSRFFTLVVQE